MALVLIIPLLFATACLGSRPTINLDKTSSVAPTVTAEQSRTPEATFTPASFVSQNEQNPVEILHALRPGTLLCTGLTTSFGGQSPELYLFTISLSSQNALELDIIQEGAQGWELASSQALGQGASCQSQRLDQYDLNKDGIFEVTAVGVWDAASAQISTASYSNGMIHEEWLAIYGLSGQKPVSLFNASSATAVDPKANPKSTSTYWDFEPIAGGLIGFRAMTGNQGGPRGSSWPYACFSWQNNSFVFQAPTGGTCPGAQVLPTITPTPTPVPTPGGITNPCPGAPASHLSVGMYAQVSQNPAMSNNVRTNPDVTADLVGTIGPGTIVNILDGPTCNGAYVWWKITTVKTKSPITGWTAEGDASNSWLIPLQP